MTNHYSEEYLRQKLEEALREHCLDVHGNLYTIKVEDVMNYIRCELPLEDSGLAGKIELLDQRSLAVEISDQIGNIGIIELIELGIRQAIKEVIAGESEEGISL